MLSSRDMTHSLVIGTSRISADIHIRMIINLHIPTAHFNVFDTTSPAICIYRQHFSTFSTLHRRQPAYTDFSEYVTISPQTCICRQHLSALVPPFHHQSAYTDCTSQQFCHSFTISMYIPTSLLGPFAIV